MRREREREWKGNNDARSWRQVDRTHQGSKSWGEKFDLKFYFTYRPGYKE